MQLYLLVSYYHLTKLMQIHSSRDFVHSTDRHMPILCQKVFDSQIFSVYTTERYQPGCDSQIHTGFLSLPQFWVVLCMPRIVR